MCGEEGRERREERERKWHSSKGDEAEISFLGLVH